MLWKWYSVKCLGEQTSISRRVLVYLGRTSVLLALLALKSKLNKSQKKIELIVYTDQVWIDDCGWEG